MALKRINKVSCDLIETRLRSLCLVRCRGAESCCPGHWVVYGFRGCLEGWISISSWQGGCARGAIHHRCFCRLVCLVWAGSLGVQTACHNAAVMGAIDGESPMPSEKALRLTVLAHTSPNLSNQSSRSFATRPFCYLHFRGLNGVELMVLTDALLNRNSSISAVTPPLLAAQAQPVITCSSGRRRLWARYVRIPLLYTQ